MNPQTVLRERERHECPDWISAGRALTVCGLCAVPAERQVRERCSRKCRFPLQPPGRARTQATHSSCHPISTVSTLFGCFSMVRSVLQNLQVTPNWIGSPLAPLCQCPWNGSAELVLW